MKSYLFGSHTKCTMLYLVLFILWSYVVGVDAQLGEHYNFLWLRWTIIGVPPPYIEKVWLRTGLKVKISVVKSSHDISRLIADSQNSTKAATIWKAGDMAEPPEWDRLIMSAWRRASDMTPANLTTQSDPVVIPWATHLQSTVPLHRPSITSERGLLVEFPHPWMGGHNPWTGRMVHLVDPVTYPHCAAHYGWDTPTPSPVTDFFLGRAWSPIFEYEQRLELVFYEWTDSWQPVDQ